MNDKMFVTKFYQRTLRCNSGYEVVVIVGNTTDEDLKDIKISLRVGDSPDLKIEEIDILEKRSTRVVKFSRKETTRIVTCEITCNGNKYMKNKIL